MTKLFNIEDRLRMFSSYHISQCSKYNISEDVSDVTCFIREYGAFVLSRLKKEESNARSGIVSFAENKFSIDDITWMQENYKHFIQDTPNENLAEVGYLSEVGFVCCMVYSSDGQQIIVGHSTGFIQMRHGKTGTVLATLRNIQYPPKPIYALAYSETEERICYASCTDGIVYRVEIPNDHLGIQSVVERRQYDCAKSALLKFHGSILLNGVGCLWTERPESLDGRCGVGGHCDADDKPYVPYLHTLVVATATRPTRHEIELSAIAVGCLITLNEFTEGQEVLITPSVQDPPSYCIRADPALECLSTQFYGASAATNYATPFVTQRSPALSLGITVEQTKIVVGYADASIKVYDLDTQLPEIIYTVHKMRVQFIPKKMQRLHTGQVCALSCHPDNPNIFASAAWDETLRIWDTRVRGGCIMTFEGVNVCNDSIDLNREHCISGSWQPTEALIVWDLPAKKQLNVIRVQNRRPDVDGEYIYACRYWRSGEYNRKGKYAIIGGSGTQCVEVINLHNRYISCSYPAEGTITAITSYEDRIAFGGTTPVINIVSFHDPKHEKYDERKKEQEDISRDSMSYHDDEDDLHSAACSARNSDAEIHAGFVME